MNGDSRPSSAQDIEFLAKVAAFWKAKDSQMDGSKQFGRFVIQRCLGQGGFGVVYLAFDPLVGREVAIKVPGVQSLFDESRIKRFLAEAQHLGALAHPNIAQVYEASEVDGLCYIAMKYYPDGSLAEWLLSQSKPLKFMQGLELFKQIVTGVAAAHSAGLIHRDLKPSNILLDLSKSHSNCDEVRIVPCVADFGLAKNLLDSQFSNQTAENTRIGTIGYVAPEQWQNGAMVSPASDVYSLGAILVELLTNASHRDPQPSGTTAASSSGNHICIATADSLSRLGSEVPSMIVQICHRCLRENPHERYADANELRKQLELVSMEVEPAEPSRNKIGLNHHLKHEPFSDNNKTNRYKTAGATSLFALVAIGVCSWLIWGRETIEATPIDSLTSEQIVVPRERLTRDYALGIRSIFDSIASDSAIKRRNSLDQVQSYLTDPSELPFEAKYLKHLPDRSRIVPVGFGNTHLVLGLLACPQRPIVALHGPKNDVMLFDLDDNRFLRRLGGLTSQQRRFAFSSDGRFIAGSSLTTTSNPNGVLEVIVWDVSSGKRTAELDTVVNASYIFSLQFLSSDQLLVSGHCDDGYRIKVVSIPERRVVGNDAIKEVLPPDDRFENPVVLYDTREYRLLSAIEARTRRIAFIHTEKETKKFSTRIVPSQIGAFSEWNGRLVAYVEASEELHSISKPEATWIDQKLIVWDPKLDITLFEKELGQSVPISAIALSNSGDSVLSIDATSQLRIDKMTEPTVETVYDVHSPNEVWGVDFHPERKQLLSASDRGFVALHSTDLTKTKSWSLHGEQLVTAVQWRPQNNEQFASAGFDNAVRVWQITGEEPKLLMKFSHPSKVRCMAFSPTGDRLATGCDDGKIRMWSLEQNECLATLDGHTEKIRCLDFSLDGAYLASGANDRQIILWSATEFKQLEHEPVPSNPICCSSSQDGDRFVVGTQAGTLCIRSWKDTGFRQDIVVSAEQIRSVAISRDGKTIATGSQDGAIGLWNLETGVKLADFAKQQSAILSLSFSHGNEALSAGLYSGTVVTWNCIESTPMVTR